MAQTSYFPTATPAGKSKRPRNPVMYPTVSGAFSHAMPSLAKPERASLQAPAASPAQTEPEAESAAIPTPVRRVHSLPVPLDEHPAPPPPVQNTPAPALPAEARLEDSKTVYVVSDIVDALRADAGYDPLPRDPQRLRTRLSLWAKLRQWIRRWR